MEKISVVSQIKERADIVEIISQYTSLIRAGKHYKGKSPFTNEKTASFFVDPVKQVYYCFSSQNGGDVFRFLQTIEGITFRDALVKLADKYGIAITEPTEKDKLYNQKKLEHIKILTDCAQAYHKFLDPEILEYLSRRGLKKEIIDNFCIGYAPNTKEFLEQKVTKNKKILIETGMLVMRDDTMGMYSRFRDRVMFPFIQVDGSIVGFTGRAIRAGQEPKYLNSPETMLFKKSNLLYGIHLAQQAIRKSDYVILMEGQFDVLMAHQSGYAMTVCTSGTALTKEHIKELKKMTNRIVFCFDGDNAGLRAVVRGISIALEEQCTIKIITLPEGKDPADILLADENIFSNALKEKKEIVDWFGSVFLSKLKTKNEQMNVVQKVFFPICTSVKDPLTRAGYLSDMAKFLEIPVKDIQESFNIHFKNFSTMPTIASNIATYTPPMKEKYAQALSDMLLYIEDTVPEDLQKHLLSVQKIITLPMATESASLRYSTEEGDPHKDFRYILLQLAIMLYREQLQILLNTTSEATLHSEEVKKEYTVIKELLTHAQNKLRLLP